MSGYINNPLSATAGAIPYLNAKGQVSMKAVQVNRYVAGKVPEYGKDNHNYEEDNAEDNDDDYLKTIFPDKPSIVKKIDDLEEDNEGDTSDEDCEDRRLQRLRALKKSNAKFEVMGDSDSEEEDRITKHIKERQAEMQLDPHVDGGRMDDGNNDDMDNVYEEDEEEITRRRALARERALAHELESANDPSNLPILVMEEMEEDDYVEYSDEEDSGPDSDVEREPKMKPVYVAPNLRRTINKTAEEVQKEQEKELKHLEQEKAIKLGRKRIIEESKKEEVADNNTNIGDVDTSDENDTFSYESWSVREVKRLKRSNGNDEIERTKEETARIHALTDEQRLEEFKKNPKQITNAAEKGKMKFLQKYHHRGGYFVQDLDDKVFQRDFTKPTLEDNFNMLNRPKVLQVKNFGRAGRTKYTHLVDQDTTDYDSGWSKDGLTKFHNNRGGGMKQIFDKPVNNK